MAAGKRRAVAPGLKARALADGTEVYEYQTHKRLPDGKRDQRSLKLEGISSTPETREADDRRALEAWGALRTQSKEGKQPVPKGDLRLNALADELFARLEKRVERGELAERTLATYRGDWERHVKPFFCNALVGKLTHRDVVDLLDEVKSKPGRNGQTAASFTVNNVLTVMRKLSRYAYEMEYMPVNICDWVPQDERPRQQPRDGYVENARTLRDDELTTLLDYMREHEAWYVGVATTLAYTGTRRSEAQGLRWQDVDLEASIIRLRTQLMPLVPGQTPTHGKRKEERLGVRKRLFRAIPVMPRLRQELLAQKQRELALGLSPNVGDHYCFTAMEERGRPVDGATITRSLARSGERSGIGRVTPKDLRRTAATIFASAGIDRFVASQILGHTPEVYDANYARAYADDRERREVETMLAAYNFGAVNEVQA